ncbi:ulp1 protease family, C-terminal catalytic domain-containing protein [Tanacetum coccineum]
MLRWLLVRKMVGAYFISDSDLFESLGPQELVDNNVLSSWSAYLNFLEGKKDKNSPARLFLPMFEVDTKVIDGENAQIVGRLLEYVEKAHSTYGGRTKLEQADIISFLYQIFEKNQVFIRVSNNQHQFLLCVNMKNPVVSFIDSKKQVKKVARKKKKVEDIDDMRVASILQLKLFKLNLCAVLLSGKLIRGLKIVAYFLYGTWRLIWAMNWKCGLADEGRKYNTQLGRLRNKYAAKIPLPDCNIYKSKIHEEMDGMKYAIVNVKAIKVSEHGK